MGFIRLLLALSVVIAHSEEFMSLKMIGGAYAVELFFIISGFYMAMILSNKYQGEGSYLIFLKNRALKIYPMYFVSILIVMAISFGSYVFLGSLGRFEAYEHYSSSLSLGSLSFLILSNVLIFGQDAVMFLGVDVNNGSLFFTPNYIETSPPLHIFLLNSPAWSISVELMFYLIAPFLVNRKLSVVLIIAFLSFSLKYTLMLIGYDEDPWSYRFFPSELHLFLLGVISYKVRNIYSTTFINKYASHIGYASCVTIIGYVAFYQYVGGYFGGFVLFFSMAIPFIFEVNKDSKLDRYVGELSYPVYILHMPILMIVSKASEIINIPSLVSEITMVLSVFLSSFFIRFLMIPLDQYRQKQVQKLDCS